MSLEPEILLETPRFSIVQASTPTASGVSVTRQWMQHPGAVVILPLLPDGGVCLIRNYRGAVGQTLIELPAGTLEKGEDPLKTARRELIEETGYRAGSMEKVHEFFMSPGIMNERMHLFVATDLTAGESALEPGEEIQNLVVSWKAAMNMTADGQIQDAKSLIGLLLYDRIREG